MSCLLPSRAARPADRSDGWASGGRSAFLILAIPLLVLGAPSAQAQAATCTIDPQVGPVTGRVGTELTFFITVTGCASSNKQPSFKVVDGRVPPGTKLFDFAGSTGLINGVSKTAGSFRVTDETRATDTETFTIEILPPEAPTITTEALSSGTVGEFYCCGNLFASGGVQPYTWSVVAGALPPGLSCRSGRTPSPERPPRLARSRSPFASPTIWAPSVRRSSLSRSVDDSLPDRLAPRPTQAVVRGQPARRWRGGRPPSLRDLTRTVERPPTFASPEQALAQLAADYRRDLLEGQDTLQQRSGRGAKTRELRT